MSKCSVCVLVLCDNYHDYHNNCVSSKYDSELCNARMGILISCHTLTLLPSTLTPVFQLDTIQVG